MGFTLSGVVTLGLLIFLSIGLNNRGAEGCSCFPDHPQNLFCTSEIVIQAEITEEQNISDNISENIQSGEYIRYKIEIIKVFKGFDNITGIQYVYTPEDEGICGVRLHLSQYVLSGILWNGGIMVELCDLVKQWDSLSLTEKGNFNHTFHMGCNCTISKCTKQSCCKSQKECLWTPVLFSQNAQEFACIENSDGSCSWYRGHSKAAENDKMVKCKP